MKKLALLALVFLGVSFAYAEVQWIGASSIGWEKINGKDTNKRLIAGYEKIDEKKVAAIERRTRGTETSSNARGELDPSFGNNGLVIIPIGTESYVNSIDQYEPDGKKTLYGYYVETSTNQDVKDRADRKDFTAVVNTNGEIESIKAEKAKL